MLFRSANIGLYKLPGNTSGKQKWYMSSDDFVADAIKNVEGKLAEANRQLTVCKGIYTYDSRISTRVGYDFITVR